MSRLSKQRLHYSASLSGDVFAMMIARMLWASVAMDSSVEMAFVGLCDVGPRLS